MKKALLLFFTCVLLICSGCGAEPESTDALTEIWQETGAYLLAGPQAGFGSVGGEWLVLGLFRSGMALPEGYLDAYLNTVADVTVASQGVLDSRKYTEYSRLVLTLAMLGENPADFAGYDLTAPLSDVERTTAQGVNGAIFALLALDAVDREENEALRRQYLDYLLAAQLADGGWALNGETGQADLTAMALQALAPYQTEVGTSIADGLAFLSSVQEDNGGFAGFEEDSSESCSQVLIALDALGIDPEDPAFVKHENSVLDALLSYRTDDGGFSHRLGEETDQMATEQAFLALTALCAEGSLYERPQ